eukprot:g22361.t1
MDVLKPQPAVAEAFEHSSAKLRNELQDHRPSSGVNPREGDPSEKDPDRRLQKAPCVERSQRSRLLAYRNRHQMLRKGVPDSREMPERVTWMVDKIYRTASEEHERALERVFIGCRKFLKALAILSVVLRECLEETLMRKLNRIGHQVQQARPDAFRLGKSGAEVATEKLDSVGLPATSSSFQVISRSRCYKPVRHVPKVVRQARPQRRQVEEFVDIPVPQQVEEVVQVKKLIPQDLSRGSCVVR